MKCDFCGDDHAHTDMMEFPHRQIKSVTAFGFVPSGFARMALVSGTGREPSQYWRDIVSRYGDTDWWALCRSCQQEMQTYARKMTGAGWRSQFRFRGSRHQSGVADLGRSPL